VGSAVVDALGRDGIDAAAGLVGRLADAVRDRQPAPR
jgi:hypothetical protein